MRGESFRPTVLPCAMRGRSLPECQRRGNMMNSSKTRNRRPEPAGTLLVILPSLRISGGVQEALRLATAVAKRGVHVRLLVLWKHRHESPTLDLPVDYLSDFPPRKSRAFREFLILLARYRHYIRRWRHEPSNSAVSMMLTHFSTFPLAWLTPRSVRRLCFLQDLEWKFVPKGLLRAAVRGMILWISRRSHVITSNAFVSEEYAKLGVKAFAQASTWAEPFWFNSAAAHQRTVDVVMLLRQGAVKRLDLSITLLQAIQRRTELRCVVVTPDTEVYEQVKEGATAALLRPTNDDLKALFGKSKVFVLLSETEGFGLPPLEAMGSGCVPVCRDSGGVRCYMDGMFKANLLPLQMTIDEVLLHVQRLVTDKAHLERLSEEAHRVFKEGATRAGAERTRCFNRVARAISPRQ